MLRETGADDSTVGQPSHENDHRPLGEYHTRYVASAWTQIVIELTILLTYIGVSIAAVSCAIHLKVEQPHIPTGPTASLEAVVATTTPWAAMFFAALAGGATFATKWLYHSVAKGEWNRELDLFP